MSTTYSRWTQSGLESFAVTGPSATRDLFVRMGQHQRAIADIHRLRPKPRDAATGWQTRRFEDIHSNRIQVLHAPGSELARLLLRLVGIANSKYIGCPQFLCVSRESDLLYFVCSHSGIGSGGPSDCGELDSMLVSRLVTAAICRTRKWARSL